MRRNRLTDSEDNTRQYHHYILLGRTISCCTPLPPAILISYLLLSVLDGECVIQVTYERH